MSNTLAVTYITHLPELMPEMKILQLSVTYWQAVHAEAGSQKETAWRMYFEAVENEYSRVEIDDLYCLTKLCEDICKDTWTELENAKAQLLAFWN